jgi:hypothetical protein
VFDHARADSERSASACAGADKDKTKVLINEWIKKLKATSAQEQKAKTEKGRKLKSRICHRKRRSERASGC